MANEGFDVVGSIIILFIAIIVVSTVIPIGITLFFVVDTSSWDSAVTSIWRILPTIVLIVVLIIFVIIAGLRTKGIF